MGRMHSGDKGKFANKGLTPSQIGGVILRDSHGIARLVEEGSLTATFTVLQMWEMARRDVYTLLLLPWGFVFINDSQGTRSCT
ncbi:hypothetical protein L1887_39374 [Cichorium endivia]|nr:hypothetical protein L1887_39374 [Cichorium endivia]